MSRAIKNVGAYTKFHSLVLLIGYLTSSYQNAYHLNICLVLAVQQKKGIRTMDVENQAQLELT